MSKLQERILEQGKETKIVRLCSKCKTWLPLECFHHCNTAKRKKHRQCRWCRYHVSLKKRTFPPGSRGKQDQHKLWARSILRQAVANGKISKPSKCEKCKQEYPKVRIHGHHLNGYSDPFDVIWLCHWCHMKVGADKLGKKENFIVHI